MATALRERIARAVVTVRAHDRPRARRRGAAIGRLLVSAMMVVPVAETAQFVSSYRSTLLLGSVVGACSAALGLLVAFNADLAPGAVIV